MNNLKITTKLKNKYFALRHGESKANVKAIILSNPRESSSFFGLTEEGKKQVTDSILNNKEVDQDTIIYFSNLPRAKETAEIAKEILKTKKANCTKLLRERFFGNLEKTSNTNYDNIWANDKTNPSHEIESVESANNVQTRTTQLIIDLEKKFQEKKILLVSHGDTLQILETAFIKTSAGNHRQIKHLTNAEIRELKLT